MKEGKNTQPNARTKQGEHFEDFEPFEARSFVSRLLGLGDVQGLMDSIKETGMLDQGPEMMERFSKGQFNLRDMQSQFQNVLKLGPLNRVMSMIPGLPQGLIPKGQEKDGVNRIRRFMYMFDSMTDAELDGLTDLEKNPKRIMRVAQGSGTHPQEVHGLLTYHRQMEKMVGKMGKSKLLKGDAQMQQQMNRNPQAVMQQIAKTMDPR